MKTFQRFLIESETPQEYIARVMVRGSDEAFNECSDKCQWLKTEDDTLKCNLFKETLSTKKDGEAAYPLRTKNCLFITDILI